MVEDLEDSRELVAELLAHHGHVVLTARDGETGIELICDQRPDVAFVDIGLPKKNGYDLAREVRARLREHTPRLVAVTGYCMDSDRMDALAAGFDAHVIKPASIDELIGALTA